MARASAAAILAILKFYAIYANGSLQPDSYLERSPQTSDSAASTFDTAAAADFDSAAAANFDTAAAADLDSAAAFDSDSAAAAADLDSAAAFDSDSAAAAADFDTAAAAADFDTAAAAADFDTAAAADLDTSPAAFDSESTAAAAADSESSAAAATDQESAAAAATDPESAAAAAAFESESADAAVADFDAAAAAAEFDAAAAAPHNKDITIHDEATIFSALQQQNEWLCRTSKKGEACAGRRGIHGKNQHCGDGLCCSTVAVGKGLTFGNVCASGSILCFLRNDAFSYNKCSCKLMGNGCAKGHSCHDVKGDYGGAKCVLDQESTPASGVMPVDQCKTKNPCHAKAICSKGTSATPVCECQEGYTGNGKSCVDVDECKATPPRCSKTAKCINHEGSFTCSCGPGYLGDGFDCFKVTRCGKCDLNAVCIKEIGQQSKCQCASFYKGDGLTCTPINTCEEQGGLKPCDKNATCSDGFAREPTCTCNDGYFGNGYECTPVPKGCSKKCNPGAECIKVAEAEVCVCKPGIAGDGQNCLSKPSACSDAACHSYATCSEFANDSERCVCLPGFAGDGRDNCSALKEYILGDRGALKFVVNAPFKGESLHFSADGCYGLTLDRKNSINPFTFDISGEKSPLVNFEGDVLAINDDGIQSILIFMHRDGDQLTAAAYFGVSDGSFKHAILHAKYNECRFSAVSVSGDLDDIPPGSVHAFIPENIKF